MTVKRMTHAVYDTSYHVVWFPKYRKKIFEREHIRQRAQQLIPAISDEYGSKITEIEVAVEYVHILHSFPPKGSIGEVVRIIKSTSARALFCESPSLKRRLGAGELWEEGSVCQVRAASERTEPLETAVMDEVV